jgi:hypothetical protein
LNFLLLEGSSQLQTGVYPYEKKQKHILIGKHDHQLMRYIANVPIYLTNSLQNFSHFLLRPVQWPQEEKAARSLEDTWRLGWGYPDVCWFL